MIASLDLARLPLGIAEREALALRRAGRRWFARFAVEAAAGSWRGVPFIL